MNIEGESDFAAFEAAANTGETIEGTATVVDDPKPEPEAKPEAKEPLELTDGDEAVEVAEGEEGGEEHEDGDGKKRRSKPAGQRIAELTAKLRQAERDLETARNPQTETKTEAPKRPDPADFEYGEADPAFVEALTDWKIDTREAERAKAAGENAEQTAMQARVEAGVAKAQAEAQERYEDFDDKIAAAVEARAGEPLPAVLSIGIGLSPAGGDLLYRLATDEAASKRMEALAGGGNPERFAMAFGELEGEYLTDTDDADLDMKDSMDMARMMGRMRARLKGAAKPAEPAKPTVVVTNAPEPPEQRARGGTGQFEVGADTTDFAAFERKANRRN